MKSSFRQPARRSCAVHTWWKKFFCIGLLLSASVSLAQKYPEGIWQGYEGEWKHVSQQLIALAEATPAGKFAWRPAAGVRSTSEVYMHIAMANFYLLSVTGAKVPTDLKEHAEKTVMSKADVISWLKRSLEAVKEAHLAEKKVDLQRKVHVADRDATVDGMYLRMLVHANEHMGQLVAYARMTGVVPPWSKN
ncbi:MAG: DinB family protein [Acidobacteria bacterium]|nr:DinB family protein [Acidobacteriota bacterium]